MTAEDLVKQGDLAGALAELQGRVRAHPQDARLRIFLFQLLCVMGDWKRAVAQLRTAAGLDPAAISMAQAYREAIACELVREKVFAGEKEPIVVGEPAAWIALMIEALRAGTTQAAELRGRAFEAAPAAAGRIDGQPFEWIADGDGRLGPVLEIIVNGRYVWAPFPAIARLSIDPPSDLRDTVWMPAEVTWAAGGTTVALIPTRYPGTTTQTDALRLARATEWHDLGDETWVGCGQRMLATDGGEIGLMDLRLIEIGEAAEAAALAATEEAADG